MNGPGRDARPRSARPATRDTVRDGAADLRGWLHDNDFPADTDTVLALLVHRRSPPEVMQRLAALPWSTTFTSLDDCLRHLRST